MDVLLMILLVQALSLVAFARFHCTTVLRLAVLRQVIDKTTARPSSPLFFKHMTCFSQDICLRDQNFFQTRLSLEAFSAE